MAGENTVTSLDGMFKELYGESIKNLIPDGVKLINMIPFIKDSKKNGGEYNQPVNLAA